MESMKTKKLADEVFEYVTAFRRDLHQHPEASFQEFETTAKVAAELDRLGVSYRRMEPTGLVAEITGTGNGPYPERKVAIRADMDALSIQEKTELPFKSVNDGFMHACGHDTHTAMLLGAAKILKEHEGEFAGTVRLLFQPAEEIAEGAKAFVAQGALDGLSYCFGQHIMSQFPVGSVWGAAGPTFAACDKFTIRVKGVTCHGAQPSTGVDATVAAAALIMNLQTMVSREFDPSQAVVVTVGQIHSGSRFNIISGEAFMDGTIRCFDRGIAAKAPEVLTRIAKSTAEAFRCTAEVIYERFTDVLINDEKAMAIGEAAVSKVAPDGVMHRQKPVNGSEDFSEYTSKCPCGFFILGGGGEAPQHSDFFQIDEEAFRTGVAVYVQVALDALEA